MNISIVFFLTRDLSLKDAAFRVAKKAVKSQNNHAHYESSGKFPENQKVMTSSKKRKSGKFPENQKHAANE